MIEFIKNGNLFDSGAEALVNTVNCVGVMGKGLALQFKERYPEMFGMYQLTCKLGAVKPGHMHVYENPGELPRFIINFPTKRHWRDPSRMEDIKSGLEALKDAIQTYKIKSITVPPLGAGLGGLNWSEVRSAIVETLQDLQDTRVMVYELGKRH